MDFSLKDTALYVLLAFAVYSVVVMTLAAVVAVNQERKIWKHKKLPSLSYFALIKVFFFNIVWFVLCGVGFTLISIKWILTCGTSDIEYEGNRWVEANVAKVCIKLFVGTVEVYGKENLPKESEVPAPIFVANHASQIDVGAVYFLNRRFKWIAKSSVLFLPGVGQIMWVSGHVLIKRSGKNKKSVSNLFDRSNEAIQSGVPMFFFPQGTRRIAERLPFKDGAFTVALTNKSTLVLLSVEIPMDAWNTWYPLNILGTSSVPTVKITIHKPITVTGNEDKEKLKKMCDDRIYSVLPAVYKTYDKSK